MSEVNPKDIVNQYSTSAEIYLKDKNKLMKLIDDATRKAASKDTSGPMDELIAKIVMLIGIINDYISGDYREVPWGSLVMIVVAMIYFVSPVDLVPDFIPAVGYVDDLTVVVFVMRQINSDIEKYKQWKRTSN